MPTNQRNPLACALARGNGIVPTFATTSVGAVPYLPQKSTKFTANRRTLGGVFTIRYSSSCNNSKGFQHMAHLMINSDDQCENKAKMMYSAPQNKLVTEMAPVDKMMVPVDTRRPIKTSPLPLEGLNPLEGFFHFNY